MPSSGGITDRTVTSSSWRPAKPAHEALSSIPPDQLDLSNPKPQWLRVLPIELRPHVPVRNFVFLQKITEQDYAGIRPDEKADPSIGFAGWGDKERRAVYTKYRRTLMQPSTRDGDDIVIAETYDLPKSGFPGRLYSGGLNKDEHVVRSIALEGTADLDMACARQRIYVWVCTRYGFDATETETYVDDKNAIRAKVAEEEGVSVKVAKEMLNSVYMCDAPRQCKGPTLRAIDAEAKAMQTHMSAVPELQWIKEGKWYTDKEGRKNPLGRFMHFIFEYVEVALMLRAAKMLVVEMGEPVATFEWDGLKVVNGELHGDASIVARAAAVCEEVCPGLNMKWEWKPLDVEVRSKAKKERLFDLRVPPTFPSIAELVERSNAGEAVFLFEHLAPVFSLRHKHVGSQYVIESADGTEKELVRACDLKQRYVHYKVLKLTIPEEARAEAEAEEAETEEAEADGGKKGGGKKGVDKKGGGKKRADSWDSARDATFIELWMSANTNVPFFDKSEIYPDASECPANVYNMWTPYAYDLKTEPFTFHREGLLMMLKHIHVVLCRVDEPYELTLKFLSNLVQYPKEKGVALNLVGPQGAGKTTIVDLMRRLFGTPKVHETKTPARDVWGHFNSPMMLSILTVLSEVSAKDFLGATGQLKALITDPTLTINKKGIPQFDILSYHRFLCVTNNHAASPNEMGNRRMMDLKCSGEMHEMEGSFEYFNHLNEVLFKDEDFLRTFWAFLKWYPCPRKLTHHDFFKSEYDQEMKSLQMPPEKQFISWLVNRPAHAPMPMPMPIAIDGMAVQMREPDDPAGPRDVEKKLVMTDGEMWRLFKGYCEGANHTNYYNEPRFKKLISPEALGLEKHGYTKKRERPPGAPRTGPGSLATLYTLDVPELLRYFAPGDGNGDGPRAAEGAGADGSDGGAGDVAPVKHGPHCPMYVRDVNAFFASYEAPHGATHTTGTGTPVAVDGDGHGGGGDAPAMDLEHGGASGSGLPQPIPIAEVDSDDEDVEAPSSEESMEPSAYVVLLRGAGPTTEALLAKERRDGVSKYALLGGPIDPINEDVHEAAVSAAQTAMGGPFSPQTAQNITRTKDCAVAEHAPSKARVVIHSLDAKVPDVHLDAEHRGTLLWVSLENLRSPEWRKEKMHGDAAKITACAHDPLSAKLREVAEGWAEPEASLYDDAEEEDDSDVDEAAEAAAAAKEAKARVDHRNGVCPGNGDESDHEDDSGEDVDADDEDDDSEGDEGDADEDDADDFVVSDHTSASEESEEEGHRHRRRRRTGEPGSKRKRIIDDDDDE